MTSTLPLDPVQPGQPHSAPPPAAAEPGEPGHERRGRSWLLGFWLLAFLAFLLPSAGRMTFETKLGVVADPGQFFDDLGQLWHDRAGFGGISDQYAGYLFPMLPYYWLTHLLHIPVWLAERLWLSLVVSVAFWGALRLAEKLGVGSPGTRLLGAVTYALWPAFTIIVGSTSAGVLPGAVLPWVLLPLVARELTPRNAAARSALAIPFMGGVNAASTLAALLPVLLYILTRTGRRRTGLLAWWIPFLILATLWWTVPLLLLGGYGENFLPYIESAQTTTSTMSATESLRGAGNWVAYLHLGESWLPAGWTVASSWLVIVCSAIAAGLGLAGLARRDLPERRWLVLTVLTAALVMLAGYGGALGAPFADTVRGWLDGWASPFRNIYKFQPGVALALAFGLAHLTAGTVRGRAARGRHVIPVLAAVLVLPGLVLPYVNGDVLQPGSFQKLPTYWKDTAQWLEDYSPDSRALVVPATAHGEYTWGKPIDQPLDVLADSRWAQRDFVPFGTPGNRRAMDAVDQALMTGGEVPGLRGFLHRAGLHYVVVRNDLDPDEIGYIPPATVKRTLEQSGYQKVAQFGPETTGGRLPESTPIQVQGLYSRQRAVEIYAPSDTSRPGPATLYAAAGTAVVSGGPESLLRLSADPDFSGRPTVLTGDAHPGVDRPALAVQGDGLRRADTRFGLVNTNTSYTYTAHQKNDPDALQDPGDDPHQILPRTGTDHQTTAVLRGARSVTASSTGNWLFHLPQYDPVNAFDGNPATAWTAGDPDTSKGEWLRIDFAERTDVPATIAVTPVAGDGIRAEPIRIRVQTDRGSVDSSLRAGGGEQEVRAPAGKASWLRVEILDTRQPRAGFTGAGFAEISVPDVQVTRVLQLPADAARNKDAAAETVSLHRGSDPGGLDPAASEVGLHRRFTTGQAGEYAVTGRAVPVQGQALDELLDRVAPEARSKITVTADSTSSLSPALSPRNLEDGDLTTAWIAGKSPTLHLRWKGEKSVGSMVLAAAGGISTRPTEVQITTPDGAVTTGVDANGWARFDAMETDEMDITVTKTASLKAFNPFADERTQLPVGLSEIYVPALKDRDGNDLRGEAVDPEETFELPCGQGPTVSVDGTFISTGAQGSVRDLVERRPVDVTLCGADGRTGGTRLSAGTHTVEAGDSGPLALTDITLTRGDVAAPAAQGRAVKALDWAGDQRRVSVGQGGTAYLATYENYNSGWEATLDGKKLHAVRLDGWQQGFEVPQGAGGEVELSYRPATWYHVGLWVALGGIVVLVAVALLGTGLVRRRWSGAGAAGGPGAGTAGGPGAGTVGGPGAQYRPDAGTEPGEREEPPAVGWLLGTVVVTLVAAVVAGPYALVVPALAVLAWARPGLLVPVALLGMTGAGIAAAAYAGEPVRRSEGAFSGTAQALALLALAAALVSVDGWRGRRESVAGEPGEYEPGSEAPTTRLPAYGPGPYPPVPPETGPPQAGPPRQSPPPDDPDRPTTRLGRHRGPSEEPPQLLKNLGFGEDEVAEPEPEPDEDEATTRLRAGGGPAAEEAADDAFVPSPPIPLAGTPEQEDGDAREPADAPRDAAGPSAPDTSTPPLGTPRGEGDDPATPALGTPGPEDAPPEDAPRDGAPPEDGAGAEGPSDADALRDAPLDAPPSDTLPTDAPPADAPPSDAPPADAPRGEAPHGEAPRPEDGGR